MPPASTPSSRAASGPLPPEFLILRQSKVEPWRPTDSLVWLRMMALDLATNYRDELARVRLARRLSKEQIADLWPSYPDKRADHPGRAGARSAVGSARCGAAARAARRRRLECLGGRSRALDHGRRAARERSASSPAGPRRVVSRAPRDARARAGRGDPARHSCGRARAQRQHCVGLHQYRRRYPGSVHRTRRSRGSGPVPDAGWLGAVRRARRGHRGCGRRARGAQRARDPSRAGPLRSVAGRRGQVRRGSCRGARLECARRRRSGDSGIARHRSGAGLDRVRRGAARRRRSDAEHLLRRWLGSHRLHCAGPRADPQARRRPLASAGMDRRIRLDGLGAVRRPAARARSTGRRAVQRQQPHRAAGLPLPA